jgi:hypothetical protein
MRVSSVLRCTMTESVLSTDRKPLPQDRTESANCTKPVK